MTTHELAKFLQKQPDLPVVINGWGSDEGTSYEVSCCLEAVSSFNSTDFSGPRDARGHPLPRPCILLDYPE